MQTELIDLSTGLEKVYPGDWAMLYNSKTKYQKLVEVWRKSKTQVTIEGEKKYNISTGKIVPNNPDHPYLLRGLTLEEINNLDALEMREFVICDIKDRLHLLDADTLIKIQQMCEE